MRDQCEECKQICTDTDIFCSHCGKRNKKFNERKFREDIKASDVDTSNATLPELAKTLCMHKKEHVEHVKKIMASETHITMENTPCYCSACGRKIIGRKLFHKLKAEVEATDNEFK